MGTLREADVWVKTVLEEEGEQVPDELKRLGLLLHAGHRYVLGASVHQHLQRGEVGLGAAVRVRPKLAEDADTVEVTNLHVMREVMQWVLVDERDEADHEGNTAITALHVRVASLLVE